MNKPYAGTLNDLLNACLMLTEAERDLFGVFFMADRELLSFFHQLQPECFCILQTDRKVIDLLEYKILQLAGEIVQRACLARCRGQSFNPPIHPLAGNVCRADNLNVGINKEHRDNLAMSRFGGVYKLEWSDPMLKDVRKGKETAFAGVYAAYVLHTWTILLTSKDNR